MKKTLLSLAFLFGTASLAFSQGVITLTTSAEPGKSTKLLPNVKSATSPLEIDWGNGVFVKYTVDPSQGAWTRWIEGTIEGETITIKGFVTELTWNEADLTSARFEGCTDLKNLDLGKNKLTSFELTTITPLEQLTLSNNNLKNSATNNPSLSLENAGETLWSLSLSNNSDIGALDLSSLMALQYFTANDCPQLGSVFICLPEESRPNLQQINLNNCDLAHFYPVSLPALTSLDLANNNLMTVADTDPFALGDYPKLHSLNVSNNTMIADLDVTKCPELESLSASNCRIESIDVSQNPLLRSLFLANNRLQAIDLANNKSLQTLNVEGNSIPAIDFRKLTSLQDINITGNPISRADLHDSYYLKTFEAANTNLEFVDFGGLQPGRMSLVDLRNNKKMTSETVDYTIHTLPVAKSNDYGSKTPNLLLEGTDASRADIAYAESQDMQWRCDTRGDGSVTHESLAVTFEGATLTGNKISGTLDRLYPNMGMSIDYDLDEFQTEGGKFVVAQPKAPYYQHINSVKNAVAKGVPFYVYVYPDEGKRFNSISINGETVKDQWVVTHDPATVKVNFSGAESSLSFTVDPGQELSFVVNTIANNGKIDIDWGTGTRMPYDNQYGYNQNSPEIKGTRIDGTAAGSTVTIYGDIAAINLEGFGDAADMFGLWDNHVKSIDLSNCPDLKNINLYWNPISEIDLSQVPGLQVLDISYTNLKSVDLSNNKDMLWLEAYSDGFGDSDEGISMLKSIDVSNMPKLQYLDIKGNEISYIDLSKNEQLYVLKAANNNLASLDVTNNPLLEELLVQGNEITSIDLSKNPQLLSLNVGDNKLTALDVTANKNLASLYFDNNDIHSIDLSANSELKTIYLNGNSLTAAELNEIYYKLPQRKDDEEDVTPGTQVSWNLAVIQGTDKDGQSNEGTRADSSIATDRNWKPSHQGTNGGCEWAYLDILPSAHGSVVVKDSKGNAYGHGSKITKYEPLTIEATADEGYELKSFSLNGEDAQEGNKFDMPGIYTKLRATFTKQSGISNVNSNGLNVTASNGMILLTTDCDKAELQVVNINGTVVYAGEVANGTILPVEAGVYVVKAKDDKKSVKATFNVK